MVRDTDVAPAIIDEQFHKFVRERIRVTRISKGVSLPRDVYEMVLMTVYLDLFMDAMKESARWN